MIEQLRARLRALLDERAAKQAAIDTVTSAAEARGEDLTEAEAAEFRAAFDAVKALDAERADIEARVAELEDAEARKAAAAAVAASLPAAAVTTPGAVVVRRDERTYNPDAEKRGVSFLRDVVAAQIGHDHRAAERLDRHMTEARIEQPLVEARAAGDALTSAFAGLVVPAYLTDLVAPDPKAGRPLLEIMRKHPMTAKGMTVEISRITTPTSAAVQSSQLSAASATSIDDTILSIPIKTIAAQQTVSRQALERGTGIEAIILADMLGELNTTQDSTVINEATTGLDAVTDANVDIAYTDASPTAAELWPKLFAAISGVQSANLDKGNVDALLMHPRRFWWLASQVGTNFPFVNLVGAGPQSGGSVTSGDYGGAAGFLAGKPVYLDANITTAGGAGTNEDVIYALTTSECHLWEDPIVFLRAEQAAAATLGVVLVVSRYFAYTVSRYPNANGRVAGTGLVVPTF